MHGQQAIEINKKSVQSYQELGVVVIDGAEYTFGKLQEDVNGAKNTTVHGQDLYKVLGSRTVSVVDQLKTSVGGDEHRFIVGKLNLQVGDTYTMNAGAEFSIKSTFEGIINAPVLLIGINDILVPYSYAPICTQPHTHTYTIPPAPALLVTSSAIPGVIPPGVGGIASNVLGPVF